MIDNPVLPTIGRFEEAVVSWAKDTGTRIGTKEWVVELGPALRLQRIGVKIRLKDAKSSGCDYQIVFRWVKSAVVLDDD